MKLTLVAHWRLWWRRASTWLAAANGLLAGYVFSQPVLIVGLLGFSPGEFVIPIAVVVGLLAFGLPVLVAHISQPKLAAKREEIVTAKTEGQADAENQS
jgi:hypothetical protein